MNEGIEQNENGAGDEFAVKAMTSVVGMEPDTEGMLSFLQALRLPLYTFCRIDSVTGELLAITFKPEELATAVIKLADTNRKGRNVYYQPNPCRRAFNGKERPSKEDIAEQSFVHVDDDLPDGANRAEWFPSAIAKLDALGCTFIGITGNGLQGLKRIEPPVPLPVGDEEAIRAADERAFAFLNECKAKPGTHDVGRCLRVFGTINWPDSSKRNRGCVPVMSSVVAHHPERTFTADSLPRLAVESKPTKRKSKGAAAVVTVELSNAAPVKVDALEPLPISSLAKVVIAQGTDPDNASRFKSRSDAVWFVSCEFARAIVAANEADRPAIEAQAIGIFTDREWPISAHVFDQKNPDSYARLQLRKAMKEVATESETLPDGAIVLADGKLNENLQSAEAALLTAGVPIFERGGELVRAVQLERSEESGGVRRDAGATIITAVSDRWLVQRLADAAPFVRKNAKGDHLPADPPLEFARHLLARQGEWAFPSLRGIVSAPTMRPDGSILQSPGFDAASGLIFDPRGVVFPPIGDEPTRDDAIAALAMLDELFTLFPYEREAQEQSALASPSYAVTLSAILCTVARDAMRTVPAHANDSPTPGTGKTIQAETVAIIGTGSLPAMMSQGPSDEELEKRIATALRAGDRVIVIDNVERPVGGDFLCSVLTQERVQARILGKSERVVLPTAAVFIITGNNLQLAGDLARRAVKGRIDSGEERPDKREFPFDPRQIARAKRPQLVAAALTILRAYHVAGRPVKLTPMGSFEDYSLVRGAIVWLDRADPARTREAIFTADPKRDELGELLRAWRDEFNGEALTLAEAKTRLELASEGSPSKALYGLLIDLGGRGAFNALSIGKRLAKFIDRPASGLVLRRGSEARIGTRWHVERVGFREPAVDVPDYAADAGQGFLRR